ncbi:formate hydrogenlyase subunit 5 precursor [mine drainage metagenome]|uniref:Formate hydrogenlyase subunit 5 n=1 Tax=mine drainage metagenome TaxID=410659 RepID=A0A1J5QZI6_9ZZZZ
MDMQKFPVTLTEVPGAAPAWSGTVSESELRTICIRIKDDGGRLVALWGTDERQRGAGFALHVALADQPGLICLTLPITAECPEYPAIEDLFPAAGRMQRALHDLLGVTAKGASDQRPWLRHDSWPEDVFPLRKGADAMAACPAGKDSYPFVQVTGSGVHEIAVGPVHAGIIEPGHFRFSVVGERVLRLEERLGYAHKGIEKLAEGMSIAEAARLAGRVSGDSTVAYAWAYAMAVEGLAGCTPPQRALWLRALWLERERIANHLGDLGYLGNDVGLSFGFMQFWRLKEEWLRTQHDLFGHRYLMDCIVPGGACGDLDAAGLTRLRVEADALEQQVGKLQDIYHEHAGVQDRFLSTGRVTPALAAQLGLAGLAGRASAQAWDLRVQYPSAPYERLEVRMATQRNGDVAARVAVRFDEIHESLRIVRRILAELPEGATRQELAALPDNGFGIGWVEGWRGEVLVALHTGTDGAIHRLHPHDPSWQNWPLIEHAIIGNIVPDFPLINKSFNLSYSGQDL